MGTAEIMIDFRNWLNLLNALKLFYLLRVWGSVRFFFPYSDLSCPFGMLVFHWNVAEFQRIICSTQTQTCPSLRFSTFSQMHQEGHSTELFDQHALSSSSQNPPKNKCLFWCIHIVLKGIKNTGTNNNPKKTLKSRSGDVFLFLWSHPPLPRWNFGTAMQHHHRTTCLPKPWARVLHRWSERLQISKIQGLMTLWVPWILDFRWSTTDCLGRRCWTTFWEFLRSCAPFCEKHVYI